MSKLLFRHVLALGAATTVLVASCGSSANDSSRRRNAALNVEDVFVRKVEKIDAGANFTLALDQQGDIYGFGLKSYGSIDTPSLKDGATRFTDISAGAYHSLALDDRGNIYGFGQNSSGQTTIPPLKNGASRFTAVEAGGTHSLALDDLGNLYGFGSNRFGQSRPPILKNGATRFTAISAGINHSIALDDRGDLYPFGINAYRQNTMPTLKKGATRFTSVSASGFYSIALDDLGNLYGMGDDFDGRAQLPTLKNGGTKFTAISSGARHSLALDDRGNLYAFGEDRHGKTSTPVLKGDATRFENITAGWEHSITVDDRGNVYAFGWGLVGQLDIPPALNPVLLRTMPIAMGGLNALAIDDTGRVEMFAGTVGTTDRSDLVSVAAGPRHALAVTRSGIVEAWGDGDVGQLDVPADLNGVVQVVAGYAYSAALRADGSVVEWGSHTAPTGQLIGKPDNVPKLRQLAGGTTHILGITTDGRVVAWGDNAADKATPPRGLDQVIAVTANGYCSAALRTNGDLAYWGACPVSFRNMTTLAGATTIAMSDLSMAAIVNGQLITWGEDANGLLTPPAGLDHVALSAGTAAFLAVTSDGTVVTWGDNNGDMITIPVTFGGPPPIVNDEVCTDCEVDKEESALTDEIIRTDAGAYVEILTPEQRTEVIETLGGSTATPMTPTEIQELIESAPAPQREAALEQLEAALVPSPSPAVISKLPAAKSPFVKIGARVSATRAATILGLKRVTKVSFVKPKKSIAACTVTATRVTAKKAGTCNVRVRYTDTKKKVRTKTLSLSIG